MNNKLLLSNVITRSSSTKNRIKRNWFRIIFKGKSFKSEIELDISSLIKNENDCRKY